MMAASASTNSAAKDYLHNAPLLAGSIIKYCEKDAPKSCETIDRRNEVVSIDAAGAGEVTLKLSELYGDFSSLSVTFSKSDKVPGSFDMTFNSKLGAK
jgi:hypothetical protein